MRQIFTMPCAFAALLTMALAYAQEDVLYRVDFNAHPVGQQPLAASAPSPNPYVSAVVFGDPTVVAQHGAMLDQPCVFGNGTTGYDQLRLQIDDYVYGPRPPFLSFDQFRCEMDVLVTSLTGDFTLHFGGLGVYSIRFRADGTMSAWTQYGAVALGSYPTGQVMRVRIDIDLRPSVETVTFSLDDVQLSVMPSYTLDISNPARFRSLRWNLDGVAASEAVAIDDVIVFGAGGSPRPDLGGGADGGAHLSMHCGSVCSLDLHCAAPFWPIAVVMSDATSPVPLFGGTLLPDLAFGSVATVFADGNGSYFLTVPYGAQPGTLYLQAASLRLPTLEIVLSNAISAFI